MSELTTVLSNFEVYKNLVTKIADKNTREGLQSILEEHGERIATCPASTNENYIAAFPGGFVWYSLEVLKKMKELNKLYETNLSKDSMILMALFHDIGKIGSFDKDYYLLQESDWHRKRGIFYELNKELSNSSVTARSLWWLTSNLVLSEDEIMAINSLGNQTQRTYHDIYNVSPLAMILQHSVQAVCTLKKGVKSV